MLPAFLLTVMTPSATVQPAGPLSLTETHSSRFLPSNSTIASLGASAFILPGVTTFGTGSHTSVAFGSPFGCCAAAAGCCGACARATPVAHAAIRVNVDDKNTRERGEMRVDIGNARILPL